MTEPRYTSDLSPQFFADVNALENELGIERGALWGVMMSESGVFAHKRNPGSSATGLIQWMADKNGLYYGKTRDEFSALPAERQTTYMRRYFRPYKGRMPNIAGVYLAVFMPAQLDLARDPDAIVVGKDGPYGWAYNANAYFDFNEDLAIKVDELRESVLRQCAGPRWEEIAQRAGITWATQPVFGCDLKTVIGVQQALKKIGFDPGPIDGANGPKTAAALRVFQIANGLKGDGLIGPLTRKALRAALDASR